MVRLSWHRAWALYRFVHCLRVPVTIAAIALLLFSSLDQIVENNRVISQGIQPVTQVNTVTEFGFAVVFLLALTLTLWIISLTLATSLATNAASGFSRSNWILSASPAVLSVIPLLGVAIGIHAAMKSQDDGRLDALIRPVVGRMVGIPPDDLPVMLSLLAKQTRNLLNYNERLGAYFWGTLAATGGVVLILLLLGRWLQPSLSLDRAFLNHRRNVWIYSALAGLIVVLSIGSVPLYRSIGIVGVICSFLIVVTLLLTHLSYISDRSEVPIIAAGAALAVLWSALDLNDNHDIRMESYGAGAPRQLPRLNGQLAAWLASRPDRHKFDGARYPIYVVAAQGGGMYAAFNTASTLSAFVDRCPAFGEHFFAVSSVSGGSVGAAVFSSLMRTRARPAQAQPSSLCLRSPAGPDKASLVRASDHVLAQDLLAPLVAGAVFPDLVQRLLPFPINALDRARKIEAALESATESIAHDDKDPQRAQWAAAGPAMAGPYISHWKADGNVPALIFNTTEVATGYRRVISPFTFSEDIIRFVPPVDHDGRQMPLSTAAILSSRFPILTPAGYFEDRQGSDGKARKVRLVDGGYFDNSGVTTALDLIDSIHAAAQELKIDDKIAVTLLVLTKSYAPEPDGNAFSEAVAPARALLNARTAQESAIVRSAKTLSDRTHKFKMHVMPLQDLNYKLALGWRLSPLTMLLIEAQNGAIGKCDPSEPATAAACALEAIGKDLERAN